VTAQAYLRSFKRIRVDVQRHDRRTEDEHGADAIHHRSTASGVRIVTCAASERLTMLHEKLAPSATMAPGLRAENHE
jgi:hypothetical protein